MNLFASVHFSATGTYSRLAHSFANPLAAVGYTFETENLLTKILVWTNYYPSLIQLYGEALLRYLRQAPGRDIPYTITSGRYTGRLHPRPIP